jgi:stage II sporulation protein P
MKFNSSLKLFLKTLAGVLSIFIISGLIAISDIRIDAKDFKITLGEKSTENILLHFLRSENHYFYQMEKEETELFTMRNISTTIFQLATNIKPTDTRTFLGRELPGLSLFDTQIIIAGEGTNLATLPYESSPPLEVLLKERNVAEEHIGETEHSEAPIGKGKENTVFIYQTHSWESFLPYIKGAEGEDDAFTEDTRVNVVGLGKRLSHNLMNAGIGAMHDKTNMTQELHKRNWKTYKSYALSGSIVETSAKKNKDLTYFIDIHRDSARKETTTKVIHGKAYARLYFIVGKENKNYEQNLEFVKELNAMIEKKYPGISRGVFLKTKNEGDGVYNQDVSNRAILIEIGGVDNHIEELNRTVDAFSEVFIDYYWKSKEAKEVKGNG